MHLLSRMYIYDVRDCIELVNYEKAGL